MVCKSASHKHATRVLPSVGVLERICINRSHLRRASKPIPVRVPIYKHQHGESVRDIHAYTDPFPLTRVHQDLLRAESNTRRMPPAAQAGRAERATQAAATEETHVEGGAHWRAGI